MGGGGEREMPRIPRETRIETCIYTGMDTLREINRRTYRYVHMRGHNARRGEVRQVEDTAIKVKIIKKFKVIKGGGRGKGWRTQTPGLQSMYVFDASNIDAVISSATFGHTMPAASADRSNSTCWAFLTQSISTLPSTTTGDGLPIVTLVVFVDSPYKTFD